jgi:peptidoglycan L-alanyl-D-glutamate endopeptidase CwlK
MAFSARSQANLATVHPDLRLVFETVVKSWDCIILEGERSEAQQAANVAKRVSKTMESRHRTEYSRYPDAGVDAVDAAPAPLRWPQPPVGTSVAERQQWQKDVARFYYFAGFVLGVAQQLGVKLRHGGDWDGDRDIHEETFDDLVHFEIVRS